jgi:hypothetical protein
MTNFIIALAIVAGIWFYMYIKSNNNRAETPMDETERNIQRALHQDRQILATALGACQTTHKDAVDALSWLAGADGTVSKQELRLIFRFCEAQGTAIDQAAYKAIDKLNAGLSMNIQSTEADAYRSIAALAGKSGAYKMAFYGAANKLCGSQKQQNRTKERFIKKAEEILGGKE